ncbi:hypothetical protein JW752_01660 [Candidatus Peregrinibacteria bacterium]|nr:hypothetical protein [Candidatus Peregrinibacteria bacterium]
MEQLPRNLSSFDAACEQVATLLQVDKRTIVRLTRDAVGAVTDGNHNNVDYEIRPLETNEVALEVKNKREKQARSIRLLLKIILPRGGAPGTLADTRILKVTQEAEGKSEVLLREIV